MTRLSGIVVVLAVAALGIAPRAWAETGRRPAADGAALFERLKALEGEWTGQAGPAAGEKIDATVTYRTTAAGSAVMETLFPGTPHEMVTMYTLDRGVVVLTHYCAMRNQPRMRGRPGPAPNEAIFDFAGGANLDPKKDTFMHDARIVFVDADHVHAEWTGWQGGRPAEKKVFELERRK
jgi:hypothetical protein